VITSHPALKLNTTVTEQLHTLERHFLAERKKIEAWFEAQWKLTTPPIYGSIDLRNAGFKLAPIDMNLFPAGFNNLNPDFLSHSVDAARNIIQTILPTAKKLLVIPESHTRNLYYWSNVKTLQRILENAGFEVYLGTVNQELLPEQDMVLETGESVVIKAIQRKDNKLFVGNVEPDLIILNNDLSDGIPDVLQDLQQLILPPAELGWSQRLKSGHFQYYALVAAEFAELVNIDPWLINPLFRYCGEIDFMQQEGMECLVANAEILFAEIEKKYREYNIPHQPFLIVKADAGTYGMAVMTIRNIEELSAMNRKQRSRMSMTKGGQPVRRVIIQEGIYTFETFGTEHAVA
jgi:glutamate--cysteine ligase